MAQGIQVPVVATGLQTSINNAVKNVGTLNIPASIDPSSFKNLAQPLGKVSGLATEFEKSIAASNARVIAFGASVGIINGVQNAFSALVKTTIEVEKSLTAIGVVSGKSAQDLEKFGNALFSISKNTGQSFNVAAEAALEFSRQGLSLQETLKRTNDALTLTRFTSLSASEAVDTLTAAINSFSQAGLSTTEVLNKLVAVDSKYAVSSEDLAKGLSRVGSVANEVGLSIDDLNAYITIAQEKTARGGAVIGNALKTIFTNIRTENTIKALEQLGVYSNTAEGALKPVNVVLSELSDKLKTLSGAKRIEALEAVASKYNINILSALVGEINSASGKFEEVKTVSANASNEAYARQLELNKTLDAVLNQTARSVEQLANSLGKIGVTDNLKSLVSFFNDLLTSITDIVDSEGIGGQIAKGIVSGLSGVLFKIGVPLLLAIFVKLTKDIAQFGAESLKTILGINQQVKERQALEQAVVNTLIRDQDVMASILALSGDRTKQEQYLLNLYNRQLDALQQVKTIAASVTPALMAGGLSATSGTVKRGAGGYLPAQEASDVARGVGGASPTSKVVAIPNFAFGGGRTGTMIANTSEYIVPNFANGGSAIFNQDMVKNYGLPAGAKKLSASGGYLPNFARYVYDADRIEPDKNALLKAILASGAKKNLILGPAGSGKSTYGAGLGSFITNVGQLADATEIDILSAAAKTKDGGMSKNFQQILGAVNSSGGKVSYLYTGNMDIYSRRMGRAESGAMAGDLRTGKELSRTVFAPMNQFDFISQVKGAAGNFEMIRGAGGYVPNFANIAYVYSGKGPKYVGKTNNVVYDENNPVTSRNIYQSTDFQKLIETGVYKKVTDVSELEKISLSEAQRKSENIRTAKWEGGAVMLVPNQEQAAEANSIASKIGVEPKSAAGKKIASLVQFDTFGLNSGRIVSKRGVDVVNVEKYIKDSISDAGFKIIKDFEPLQGGEGITKENFINVFNKKAGSQGATSAAAGAIFEAAVSIATNIKENDQNPLDVPTITPKLRDYFGISPIYGSGTQADFKIGAGQVRKFADQVALNNKTKPATTLQDVGKRIGLASRGFIPNFADPLGDAVRREMSAGLSASQIRVTQDGRLRNADNPNGLAVINTRDEPNGRVPNFANVTNAQLQAAGIPPVELTRRVRQAGVGIGSDFDYGVQPSAGGTQNTTNAPTAQSQAKAFDVGKFLVFQTAVVGTTSAMQSLTEEGSTAAAVLETASGTVNTLGTAAFAMSSAMGPWGKVITIGASAVASLIPILNKWGFTLKDESDKAAEAFVSFGKKMKETGDQMTPEKFLEYLAGKKKTEKQERAVNLNAKAIEEIAYRSGISIDPKVVATLSDELAGLGLTIKDVEDAFLSSKTQIGVIEQYSDAFKDVFSGRGKFGFSNNFSGVIERTSKFNVTDFEQKLASKIRTPEFQGILQTRAAAKSNQPLSKEEENAYAETNRLASLRDSIVRSIFAQELKILSTYDTTILALDKETIALERNKSLMTETQSIQKQKRIELEKINAEQEKSNKELEIETRKKIGAGQEKTPTGLSQETIKGLDINQLIDAYIEEGRAGLEAVFNEQVKSIKGAPKSFKALGSVSGLSLEETIRAAAETRQKEGQKFATERALVEIKTPQTTLEKLNIEGKSLSEKLTGGVLYQEDLNISTQKLSNETNAKVLQYKIDGDLAKENFNSQTTLIKAESSYLDTLYTKISLEDEVNQERQKAINAARKARREEEKTAARQKDLFDEDLNQLNGKIKIARSFETQVSQNDLNLKAQKELELETINLAKSNRELIARQNNLGAEIVNNKQKVKQTSASDILNKIATGNYGRVGFAQETALSDVLRERGGANAANMSQAQIDQLTKGMSISQRFRIQGGGLLDDAKSFNEIIGDQTPKLFADGMAQAMQATLNQADNLGEALSGIAQNFLKTLQSAFLQSASQQVVGTIMSKFAQGGPVTGGSGYKDDVPAMLTGGEFVMRKSAVQKYGINNLRKMNDGGVFLPGVRGGGNISGYDALRKFATQTTTSGATDVLRGGSSSAFINLEDQSARLSRFGLLNEDLINQEVRSAQAQGLDIITKREQYRTQQRKALQQQLVGTIGSAALAYGVGRLSSGAKGSATGLNLLDQTSGKTQFLTNSKPFSFSGAYGGSIRGFSSGGSPTDSISAMLMDGEYVMSAATSKKYGKRFLDSMNSGNRPRFAAGGDVGDALDASTSASKDKKAIAGDVSITINVTGNSSDVQSSGKTNQGGIDYKKMSEKIKAVVIETINEEKRLGGSLRSR